MALLSFIYRYFYILPTTGTLGFDTLNTLNVGTMFIHTLLSFFAVIFKVPMKRYYRTPTMMWHEYRLHSVVFTFRCTLVYVLSAATKDFVSLEVTATRSQTDVFYSQLLRLCMTLAMHVIADLITRAYGEPGQTTVRGDLSRPPKSQFLRLLSLAYAWYQFLALGSHLLPHARGMDLSYNTLVAIQSSAFLMTLNRKGIIDWPSHARIYSMCLLASAGFIVYTFHSWPFILAVGMAGTARIQFCTSKYVIWPCFALGFAFGGHGAVMGVTAYALAALNAWYHRLGCFQAST